MNKLMNLKKDKKMNLKKDTKGFTLIEVVIVLVIISVLVAILVPSINSWIGKSRKKAFLSEANSVKQACQAQMSDAMASGEGYDTEDTKLKTEVPADAPAGTKSDAIELENKFDKDKVKASNITFALDEEGRMTTFEYHNKDYKVTCTNGKWGNVGTFTSGS